MTGTILMPLNSSMIAVVLPVISHALAVPVSQSAWLVSLYLIVMATFQPIAGRLGDAYGHRRLFLVGMALLFVASVLAAQSRNLEALILLRALQGLGGAIASPNAVALIRRTFRGPDLPHRLGFVSMTQGLAAAAGPLAGAVLVARFGWSSMFWVSVPFAACAILGTLWVVPRDTTARTSAVPDAMPGKGVLDLPGSGLLAAFLVLITLAIGHGALALIPVAAVAIGLFVWREAHAKQPVVDLTLFRMRAFTAANVGVWVNNFGMYITLLWMPLYLRSHRVGLGTVGPLLFAFSFAMSMASWSSSRLSHRFGRRRTVRAGFVLEALSLAVLFIWGLGSVPLALVFLVVAGVGVGLPTVSLQASSLESVPVHRAGMASGVYSTFRYMGSILASGLLVLVTGSVQGYGVSIAIVAVLGCALSFGFAGLVAPGHGTGAGQAAAQGASA